MNLNLVKRPLRTKQTSRAQLTGKFPKRDEGTGLEYWEILHGQLVDKSAAVYQIIYNFINSYSGNTATARLSVAFAPKCME